MGIDWFEESELAYLRQSFSYHGISSFSRSDLASASPLYAYLALKVAVDREVLRLVLHANTRPQRPHILFAAVQYLLLTGIQDELRDFYPGLVEHPRPREESYPYFRAFCLKHAEEIKQLVTTYGVQNNEVGRCADLLLAFAQVARRGGDKPLAMLELGASAGLNMLWDRYGYTYSNGGSFGDLASPVQLNCEVRGDIVPVLPERMPVVDWRIGIDLYPIDVHNPEAVRWLRALVWPEHRDRAQRLEQAICLAQEHPLSIVAGNALDRLPEVLARVPEETTLCIYHSYAMNQASDEERTQIFAQIAAFASTRELFRVSEEWYRGMRQGNLELFWYKDGEIRREKLAECEGHGRWIRLV